MSIVKSKVFRKAKSPYELKKKKIFDYPTILFFIFTTRKSNQGIALKRNYIFVKKAVVKKLFILIF